MVAGHLFRVSMSYPLSDLSLLSFTEPVPLVDINDTEILTWFERDRAHVELRNSLTDETIIDWWDDAVNEAIEDGYLDPRDWHGTAYDYALRFNLVRDASLKYSFEEPVEFHVGDRVRILSKSVGRPLSSDYINGGDEGVIQNILGDDDFLVFTIDGDIGSFLKEDLELVKKVESLLKFSDIGPLFDSTPSEEMTPEERHNLNPIPDEKLKRTNPKRYDKRHDIYDGPNESGHDSDIGNRYDNTIGLASSLKEIDWEITNTVKSAKMNLGLAEIKIGTLLHRYALKKDLQKFSYDDDRPGFGDDWKEEDYYYGEEGDLRFPRYQEGDEERQDYYYDRAGEAEEYYWTKEESPKDFSTQIYRVVFEYLMGSIETIPPDIMQAELYDEVINWLSAEVGLGVEALKAAEHASITAIEDFYEQLHSPRYWWRDPPKREYVTDPTIMVESVSKWLLESWSGDTFSVKTIMTILDRYNYHLIIDYDKRVLEAVVEGLPDTYPDMFRRSGTAITIGVPDTEPQAPIDIDVDSLKDISLAPIESFKQYGEVKDTPDGMYIHIDRGSDILAVAHLDTVQDMAHFDVSETDEGRAILNAQLDDRLGAYIILDLLPKLGVNADILLTEGEESGRTTAYYFQTTKQYNWIFSFDRMGMDTVLYHYDDPGFRELLKKYKFTIGHGSFSDISALGNLGVKAMNFGVGYYENHSDKANAIESHIKHNVRLFKNFYDEMKDTRLPHEGNDPHQYDRKRRLNPPPDTTPKKSSLEEAQIHFEKASKDDALLLTGLSERAFSNDEEPVGYDSVEWTLRNIDQNVFYKILYGEKIVGGFVLSERGDDEYFLIRLYVDPDFQGQGIGCKAMEFIEKMFPDVAKISLNTPSKNEGNRRFYHGLGYKETGESSFGSIMLTTFEKLFDRNI